MNINRGDQNCIELCLDGHPEAFRGLVGRYQGRLVAYLAGRWNDVERAEYVAQEAFVRAFFSLDKLKKRGSFFSWLLGIANRVAKEQQRFALRKTNERHCRELARQASENDSARDVADDHELQQALFDLPDSYREMIVLRYYAGLSCAQVAEQLGVPVGTGIPVSANSLCSLRRLAPENLRFRGLHGGENLVFDVTASPALQAVAGAGGHDLVKAS